MALIQTTYLYQVLAILSPAGLVTCQKVENMLVVDDATDPPTVISETGGHAVDISQDEAVTLLTNALPLPEPDPEAE